MRLSVPYISKLQAKKIEQRVMRDLRTLDCKSWKQLIDSPELSIPANRNKRLLAATTISFVSVASVAQALRHILGR
jgi:hypothetical protein